MSLVTSWPYPSVTVYVKRALVSSRSPIEPGVNCTVSPTIDGLAEPVRWLRHADDHQPITIGIDVVRQYADGDR